MSRLLWGFELSKAKREDGTEIELDFHDLEPVSFAPTFCPHSDMPNSPLPLQTVTSTLKPFKCTIKPRSERHAATIRREFHEATDAFTPFEQELTGEDKEYLRRVRDELI